jgi:hypothetical protein
MKWSSKRSEIFEQVPMWSEAAMALIVLVISP